LQSHAQANADLRFAGCGNNAVSNIEGNKHMEHVANMTTHAGAPAGMRRVLGAIMRSLATNVAIYKALRELESFPDHMLRDIGLNRSEIASAVRYGRANGRDSMATGGNS
jgi:uncharacterized protein YjiS (DUF1127 family)